MPSRAVRRAGLLLLALHAPVAGAECLVRDLSAALEAGVTAYQDMDAQAFSRARSAANATLECLKEPVTPEIALRFHVVDALDAWLARDPERAVLAFCAVLAINPSWTLPSSLAPADHPLRNQFQEARAHPLKGQAPVLASEEARLRVDGVESSTRPSDRPAILQWIRRDGSPIWSGYLPAQTPIPGSVLAAVAEADAPPPMVVAPPPKVEPPPPKVVKPEVPVVVVAPPPRSGPSAGDVAMLAGTGVSVLATGGLLVGVLRARSAWSESVEACVVEGACADDPDTHLADLADQEGKVRTLGYAFQGCAVVALGLGTTSLFTVRW